jgi:hypothetical protein
MFLLHEVISNPKATARTTISMAFRNFVLIKFKLDKMKFFMGDFTPNKYKGCFIGLK